ncbi:MAG: FMN-binding protein [Treponema sp.]|jgi:urocanate reductase|nr:FMN-binding protein [Treponema sp.]
MKNFLIFALITVVSGCALLSVQRGFNNSEGEVYEGTAQGFRGPITVQVRLDNGSIAEIVIVDSMEDRFVGEAAMEELADLVIMYNSTDIDAISGATESSRGFLEAVENAILRE